jgi:short-subunit dehydrogenase
MAAKNSSDHSLAWAAAGIGLLLAGNALYHELTKYDLKNKVVLVTGGSRGLGLVLSRALAARGAKLAICSRTTEQLLKAKHELETSGCEVLALTVDLTEQDEVRDMIADVIEHYGTIDVLINNAGVVQVGPVDSFGIEDYEQAMRTNFWAPLYAMQGVLPHFLSKGHGRIVNISSIGGKIAVPHLLPYSASKFALTGLSEGMHAELKKHNIHVTTVVPHLMRTGSPMNVTVKGDHKAEYALFKVSDSSPLLSQKAEVAAEKIIQAIEYGKSETILTFTAKLATFVMGIAPQLVSTLMSVTNKFLPDNIPGGNESKKGFEAESDLSQGPVSSLTDREARRNNEL